MIFIKVNSEVTEVYYTFYIFSWTTFISYLRVRIYLGVSHKQHPFFLNLSHIRQMFHSNFFTEFLYYISKSIMNAFSAQIQP